MAASLRVVSWNVLADAYVRAEWFPQTQNALLAPGARIDAVLATAASLGADVLALQEADEALAVAAHERLSEYDWRWCQKGRDRPDGCLTGVGRNLRIDQDDRVLYDDGDPMSGHVAHLLYLTGPAGTFAVANTHLRWAAKETAPDDHIGVRQARQLVQCLLGCAVAVIACDSNDYQGGPVRRVLTEWGYQEITDGAPTALVNGDVLSFVDVVAVRGAFGTRADTGIEVRPPLPGYACPSDHVPVVADISLACTYPPSPFRPPIHGHQ